MTKERREHGDEARCDDASGGFNPGPGLETTAIQLPRNTEAFLRARRHPRQAGSRCWTEERVPLRGKSRRNGAASSRLIGSDSNRGGSHPGRRTYYLAWSSCRRARFNIMSDVTAHLWFVGRVGKRPRHDVVVGVTAAERPTSQASRTSRSTFLNKQKPSTLGVRPECQ